MEQGWWSSPMAANGNLDQYFTYCSCINFAKPNTGWAKSLILYTRPPKYGSYYLRWQPYLLFGGDWNHGFFFMNFHSYWEFQKIPTDFHSIIFQRGGEKTPTSWSRPKPSLLSESPGGRGVFRRPRPGAQRFSVSRGDIHVLVICAYQHYIIIYHIQHMIYVPVKIIYISV